MTTFRATLKIHTAFGTPLSGDTLFGQLCWTAREHLSEAELTRLLEGYTAGRPWLVVSDGFPAGYLPKPTVPASLLVGADSVGANSFAQSGNAQQRKAEKAKHWIPLAQIGKSLPEMYASAVNDEKAFGQKFVEASQPHNTLNRLTGTTGEEGFAPYTQPQIFFARDQSMDVYCVLDESRMSLEKLKILLEMTGSFGFGRDASIGLGKFTVENICANEFAPTGGRTVFVGADFVGANSVGADSVGADSVGANLFAQNTENSSNKFKPSGIAPSLVGANSFTQHPEANAYLTLAPCAPQGQGFDGDKSYWRVITRFGRHGNLHGLSGKPFKNPVLLAATGAVFVPQDTYTTRQFIGQGLGGDGQLSKIEAATVHQGYAPVVCIRMGD
jgi:CRISPR-associated protein Csm4